MSAACVSPIHPSNDLERAFAIVGLERAISSSTQRDPSSSARPGIARDAPSEEVDVAIIVALREEFRHLYPWLNRPTPVEIEGHQYYRSTIEGDAGYSVVSCFVGDMGPVPAAIATSRLIDKWRPKWVVLLGVGGAVSKDVALGDIVVATQVDSYLDAGKAVDDDHAFTLQPSGAVFRAHRQLVSRVRNFEFTRADRFAAWQSGCRARYEQSEALVASNIRSSEVQLHDGTIASGPLVGASVAFRTWLARRERGYKAIEMEGGAAHWAAEQSWSQPRTLVVRGMSDRADPNKSLTDETGRGAVRTWAMQNAIAFVWKLFEAGLLDKEGSVASPTVAAKDVTDAQILKSFERVLDRPALYEPFDGCQQRDFADAIADMIKALNTGVRSTRDGTQLESVLSRFDLNEKKTRDVVARIVRDLGEVRERHARLVQEGKVSAGCGCIKPLNEATKIDELRERIVSSFKSVYPDFNVVVRRSMTAPRRG
jgi:nucleoside phosphorylase